MSIPLPQTSDRTFQIWEYQVSHAQLLIRSPKAPATSTTPEFLTNIDFVCHDVEYMALPGVLRGFEVASPTSAELHYLETVLGKPVELSGVKMLVSQGKRFSVVASSFSLSENDWDIFESPFEFRSQFRGNR